MNQRKWLVWSTYKTSSAASELLFLEGPSVLGCAQTAPNASNCPSLASLGHKLAGIDPLKAQFLLEECVKMVPVYSAALLSGTNRKARWGFCDHQVRPLVLHRKSLIEDPFPLPKSPVFSLKLLIE